MLRKLFIVIIAALAGLWFIRRQARQLWQRRDGESSVNQPKPSPSEALSMVACSECGAYFSSTANNAGSTRCEQCLHKH